MGRVINTILNLRDNFSDALRRTDENTRKFTANLHKADKAADKIIGTFGNMAKAAAGFGAAVTGAALAFGTKSFNDYDTAVRQAAASTGMTADEMSKLKETMKGVYGNNFGESWEDVGQSVSTVQKYLNGTGEDIQKATENALAFRDVFGAEVSESMRSVDALMKNFGVSSDEAFNLIAQGYQNNLDFSGELIDSINEYSVHFQKVGVDAETMFAMIAAGAENGAWNVDKIGDAVKEFGIKAIDGSKTTQEGFKAIGLNADEMARKFGAGGNEAKEAFGEVINALKSMDDPLKMNAAGVNLFGTMWEDLGADVVTNLNDIENGFDMTKDTMGEINKIKYTGFTSAIKGIGRQIEVAAMPIGEALMPHLNEFANWLNDVLPKAAEKFSQFITKNIGPAVEFVKARIEDLKNIFGFLKDHMDIIIPVISGVVSGLAAFVVITKVVKYVDMFRKAIKDAGSVMKLFNRGLLASPLTWIAVAIGVLVAAIVLAYRKSETFRNFVNQLWSKLKEFGSGLKTAVIDKLKSFGEWISNLWSKLKEFGSGLKTTVINNIEKFRRRLDKTGDTLKEFGLGLKTTVIDKLKALGEWFSVKIVPLIKQLGANIMNLWNNILKPAAEFIGAVFEPAFSAGFEFIKSAVSSAVGTIGGLIESALQIFNGLIKFITGVFTGDWEGAWEGVVDVFGGIVGGIKSIFSGIMNPIIDIINGVIRGINNIAAKAASSNFPGLGWAKNINIPELPKFAAGTNYFTGGMALVGERGPEIVKLPGASKVYTTEKTKNILSNTNNGTNVNINIHGNFYGNETAAEQLGETVARKILIALKNK